MTSPYSHTDIWNAIDRLAGSFGYSPSGLAKKAGLDPTTFNKSKRVSADGKPRWPSTESIAKILSVTGTSMSEFFSMAESGTLPQGPHAVPLLGSAQAGRDGYFDDAGFPQGQGWERVVLPLAQPARQGLYALKIAGDSMAPLYRAGDVVIVEAGSTPRRGDRVVVRTAEGEVMVKELGRQSAGQIELISLNPGHEALSLPPGQIQWMSRILWVSQ